MRFPLRRPSCHHRSSTASHPRYRPLLERLEDRTAPADLPTGFTESAVATGLNDATAMEIAPNGDLWVLEQGGKVKRFVSGSTTADVVGNINNLGLDSNGERGLLGIAFDPAYATNKQVYLYYTATKPNTHNRVAHFTVIDTDPTDYYFQGASTTPTDAGSSGNPTATVILDLEPAPTGATNHNGGAIHFGPDGKLYVAVGEHAVPSDAQSLQIRHGKMLRIDKNGGIPTDNPFYNVATGNNRAIWALGLRNPFTFTFQPGTGRMFINDVGQDTTEEIDQGVAGANYGWPRVEGTIGTPPSGPGTYTAPLYTYTHGSGDFQGQAITGGVFYNPATSQFPAEYDGVYFFADYVNSWIHVFDPATSQASRFADNTGSTVDLHVGADGSLYYLSRGSGNVFRVLYTADPTPAITMQPSDATVPRGGTAHFTVGATGQRVLLYQWQVLVGSSWTGLTDTARFAGTTTPTLTISSVDNADAGQYRVVVTNDVGTATSAPATLTVTANQAPVAHLVIRGGLTNGKFIAGQKISFLGSAADPEDGSLKANRFTWKVEYITSLDSGSSAVRPFVPEFGNTRSGSFTPAVTGPYTLADVAYRITFTVRDKVGLTTTITQDIFPNTVTLTADASTPGLEVTLDGQPFTVPHAFASVVGFQRTLGSDLAQALGGVTYDFGFWSDGGLVTHTIRTPAVATSYLATYVVRARINFQASSSAGFPGYLPDTGALYGDRGNGYTYGWDVDNTAATLDRNDPGSPDKRFDTLVVTNNHTWELAVPNGTYRVRLVAGDPSAFDSVYQFDVEGVRAIDGTPTTTARWLQNVVTVTVADGRLTVANGPGAVNNKLAFVEVAQVPASLPSGVVGAYAFDEATGTRTADASSRRDDGTLKGPAAWQLGVGGTGSALSLSGNGFVSLARGLQGALGHSATLAFWIKTGQTGKDTPWMAPGVLGVEKAGSTNDIFWGYLDATGRIGIQAGNKAGARSSSPINDNQWHHVIMTRNASTGVVEVWVDGVLNAIATSDRGAKMTPFRSIGRIEDTADSPGYLEGALDNLRIFNRVLTPEEIRAISS